MSQTDSDSTHDDFIAGAPADPADSQNLPNENGSADELANDDDDDVDVDNESPPAAAADIPDGSAASYALLMDYPDEPDYYALLGLAREPAPSASEIRSAFRSRTLSFHPDHQPTQYQGPAARHFELLRVASETLLDPHKRTVYDLLGAEGVRREWARRGAMGKFGEARTQQVGVRAMSAREFRGWFLETMKRRERRVVERMVNSRVFFLPPLVNCCCFWRLEWMDGDG